MNPSPLLPVSVLDDDGVAAVHRHAMRVLADVGVEVHHERGRALLAEAGARVDDTRVFLSEDLVLALAAQAPERFTVVGRDPSRAVTLGGGSMLATPVGGSPFVSDLSGGRRDATLADHDEIIRLSNALDHISIQQSGCCEAADIDETIRHLYLDRSALVNSTKPYITYATSGPKARDGVQMAALACGGSDAIAERPAVLGVVNPNSPLVWDYLMVDALLELAGAAQATIITPFLLAGATAPIGVAGGLALLVAESLVGVAMAQLARPGAPVMIGSFLTPVDMRSGGPAFGTPEAVLATLAGGQLARHYRLPYRGGGGLCSANSIDAQAATETLMTMWAAQQSGSDLVMHAAGWLEGGLTASFEKLVMDHEVLRAFDRIRGGIDTSDEAFAFDAITDVGPGGMFLGADHTVANFREWVWMSPLFRAQAYPTWVKWGSPSSQQNAAYLLDELRSQLVEPDIDPALSAEIDAFVASRSGELLGDA